MTADTITDSIIDVAKEVHRELGPGLRVPTYRECLHNEFLLPDLSVKKEQPTPVVYAIIPQEQGYRTDMATEDTLVVANEPIERFTDVHFARHLT